MKTKIVLWGANEADEKLLIGVELVDKENKVLIHKIPEAAATEEVYKMMMDSWREGKEMTWPAEKEEIIRELSVAEGLLPDDIKVERTDVISRAKAEWHFVVLSSKLYDMYNGEVDDFKDKVEKLKDFDNTLWEELKSFWTKVQNQVQDKNLFRQHAGKLRAKTNELFDAMKSMKKTADTEFKKQSKTVVKEFKEKLAAIDEKVEKGLGLKPIFEELKKLQAKVKDAAFTRDDRNDIWKKIDKSFKAVKEKRFGDSGNGGNSGASRLEGRYNGLISAINRMQGSIKKDNQEKSFQTKRINVADGQLEAQLRQAKLVMVDERINSKQVKLDDMLKTKVELEQRMEREKVKETARAEKAKSKEVANELKAKIKEEIAAKQSNRTPEEEAELKKAADTIAATKKKRAEKETVKEAPKSTGEKVEELLTAAAPKADAKSEEPKKEEAKEEKKEESLMGAITATMSEALENVADTVKAISSVVSDKVEDKVDEVKASLSDNDKGGEGSGSILDAVKDAVSDTIEKVKDAGESVVDALESKMEEEKVGDKAKSIMDKITSTVEEAVEKVKDAGESLVDAVESKMEEEKVGDKAKSIIDKFTSTVEEAVEKVKDVSAKVADEVEEKISDVKESMADSKEEKAEAKSETKSEGFMGALTGTIDEVVDTAKDLGEVVSDKLDDITGEEE